MTTSAQTPGLEVRDLTVAFGGNVAVSSANLAAPRGRITGLIGPNGAGKTTTFNACCGLVKPKVGSISLFGADITTNSPAERARSGLGRTFQRVEMCDAMTVAENVAVGCEARAAGANPWRQLVSRRTDRRAIAGATADALERCGISDHGQRLVSRLSTGERRLVEMARVLAGGFQVLLLDEPSSGLDDAETHKFASIVRAAVNDLGVGILLVEHDMGLVMDVCEYIYVLDFGQGIFEGSPRATRDSEIVRSAYLGATDAMTDGAQSAEPL
jgi:ABC-type branched-subunit amino acid transport system ATPase component